MTQSSVYLSTARDNSPVSVSRAREDIFTQPTIFLSSFLYTVHAAHADSAGGRAGGKLRVWVA
jgi:hypothetical protein